MSKMTTEFNNDDWLDAYHAWEALHQLVNAKGVAQTAEAMQSITPELMERLLDVVNKLRTAVPAPEEDEHAELPVRELRFPRTGVAYRYLMHIAAYRYMRDDEARMLRGEPNRPDVLYGIDHTFDLWHMAEQYRWAYTHMYRGYGVPHKQYANPAIRYLVEFSPSDRELDLAAEYYRNNPE